MENHCSILGAIHRDPSIQIIPALGPKVCKYYLHWAGWIPISTITIAISADTLLLLLRDHYPKP